MKKLKYVSMMALFLSGAAIAQQGVIFNKSTIYEQSVHYQIIYKKDDQYVILEDKTIAIPASRYTVINFPSSTDPDHTILSVLSATQKNGAKDDNALVATEEDHKVARDYINSLPRCSIQ